jgi:hypothetical protein
MGLFGFFKKRLQAHMPGDRRCAECPDHWPVEHQTCGGLFHANLRLKPGETYRAVVCDKCGKRVEINLVGNIGSVQFPAEVARQLERKLLAELTTSEREAPLPTSVSDVMDQIIVVPEQPIRPVPKFEDAGSVFAGRNVGYCIEKFSDYIHHPNIEITACLAEFGWERVVDALRDLEAKIRRYGANPENSQFPTALFAAMELQQYVSKHNCAITSEIEASIYLQSLEHDLDELRRWERDLDEETTRPTA